MEEEILEDEEQTQDSTIKRETVHGPEQQILIVTDKGFGTRTTLAEFRVSHRGTKGNKAMTVNEKNGQIVGIKNVNDGELFFLGTKDGLGALLPVDAVPFKARGRFGVVLMKLNEGDVVTTVA